MRCATTQILLSPPPRLMETPLCTRHPLSKASWQQPLSWLAQVHPHGTRRAHSNPAQSRRSHPPNRTLRRRCPNGVKHRRSFPWQPSQPIYDFAPDCSTQSQPAVALDSDDTVYALWIDGRGGSPALYWAAQPDGDAWSANLAVPPAAGSASASDPPSLAIDAQRPTLCPLDRPAQRQPRRLLCRPFSRRLLECGRARERRRDPRRPTPSLPGCRQRRQRLRRLAGPAQRRRRRLLRLPAGRRRLERKQPGQP